MKLDKSQLSMVSMMRLLENMVMQIHGNIVPRFLIILVLVLLLKEKSFVFTEDFHQKSKRLIKWDLLIEEWKSHMKDLSVIWCGQIPKILRHGLCLQEVQDGYLAQRSPPNTITLMTSTWLPEHINLSWMDSNIGLETRTWLPFGPLQTIAIDVVMLLQSWMSMTNLKRHLTFSMHWEIRLPVQFLIRP